MRISTEQFIPVTLLFIFVSCASKETRLLKFNLEKGKLYDYGMVMNLEQKAMGETNSIGITAAFTINVVDDHDTVKTLEMAYYDFKMNMGAIDGEIRVDALQKPDTMDRKSLDPRQILKQAFSGIIGKKFTMKVNAEGKIKEITGFEEIIKGMMDNLPEVGQAKAIMSQSMKEQFNPERMNETFTPMFNIYPNKKVGVGDKWSNSYELSLQGMNTSSEFTVKSFQGDKAVIEVTSKMISIDENVDPTMAAMKISGTQTGIMTLHTTSGLVIDGTIDQDFEMLLGTTKVKVITKTKTHGKERN